MNKSNFFEVLHKKNNHLLKEDIEQSLNSIIEHISDTLVSGNRVEIRGFGTFSVKHRNQRIGRNPKTGKSIQIDKKYHPYFRSSKLLKETLNK
jgi:Bacterial nucleoid DNA-binding protein